MTGLDQVLGDREGNCQADAAANDGAGALGHLGGNAQRAHDVTQRLAGLVGGKHLGGLADYHEDELDPALVTVPAGQGKRDALARLVGANHEELSSVRMFGDSGRLDAELEHLLRELRLLQDLIHRTPLLLGPPNRASTEMDGSPNKTVRAQALCRHTVQIIPSWTCCLRVSSAVGKSDLPKRDRFILAGFIRQNGKRGRPRVVMRPAPFGALCVVAQG